MALAHKKKPQREAGASKWDVGLAPETGVTQRGAILLVHIAGMQDENIIGEALRVG